MALNQILNNVLATAKNVLIQDLLTNHNYFNVLLIVIHCQSKRSNFSTHHEKAKLFLLIC